MSRYRKISFPGDASLLDPCSARFVELAWLKCPEDMARALIRPDLLKENRAGSLSLALESPSKHLLMQVVSNREGIEIRLSDRKNKASIATLFHLHPQNFHRTSESAADFIEKIVKGHVVVAREKATFLFFFTQHKLRYLFPGDIIGKKAKSIAQVYSWQRIS